MSSEVKMSFSEIDITPDMPVFLQGQYYPRISKGIHSHLKAVGWASESNGQQVIFVTVDLAGVPKSLMEELKIRVADRISDFDVKNLIVNAIHTHSGPVVQEYPLWSQDDNTVMPADEYRNFLLDSLTKVVIESWTNRKLCKTSVTSGYAVLGHNRRVCYTDGTVEMYGLTDRPDFAGFEGAIDPKVNMLWCWDKNKKLTGIILNFACPSQVMESTYFISSDFAGEARRLIKEKFGQDVQVLCQIGMAGDLSPHDLTDKNPAELWNEKGVEILGTRLARVVEESFEDAKKEIKAPSSLMHTIREVSIPVARVSYEQYLEAYEELRKLQTNEPQDDNDPSSARSRYYAEIKANEETSGRPGPYDTKRHDFVYMQDHEAVIERYKSQNSEPFYKFEMHVVRFGDIVFATNPFEICVDFGHQIKARSKVEKPFLIQLACDIGGYVPTARTVYGGGGYRGYGAMIINGKIDAHGGKQLVDLTVEEIKKLWK